ncbi:hypothetical protein M9H77_23204 [Catharanthus roseus]|uniref:Uncharacterized protein n=1 Tax=Catharanthus roseus TaxID=4058 RepID=A0ACC0AT22_CATRO|nr:hypothetical protein M9H77_23204 [Catharanthus roseus]
MSLWSSTVHLNSFYRLSLEFVFLIQFILGIVPHRFFIRSWNFKSSIEVLQIKEEILGGIWIQFFKHNRIHIPSITKEAPKLIELPHVKLEIEEIVETHVEKKISNVDSCDNMNEKSS